VELIQSRALTPAEAMRLTKAVTRGFMRGLKRDPWFWLATAMSVGGMGVVCGLAIALGYLWRRQSPELTYWTFGGVIAFYVGMKLYMRVNLRHYAQANGASMPAGSRHVLDDRGYTTWRGEQMFFLPWHSILSIEEADGLTVISTSPAHFWPIIPAAFDTAAAARFTAELRHRWQQAKAEA
jgi:hypothetical protein